MKTAISIPDSVFNAAEQLARRLGMTRSDLYATAVDSFVKAHQDDQITAELDQIYASEESSLDAMSSQLQALSLLREEW
jgi:metal-responsive CopG/Arc/MetJ family transcriptional regulator